MFLCKIKTPFPREYFHEDLPIVGFVVEIHSRLGVSLMSLFDLEEQYTFYASYHSNLVNKLVHILFVPVILWSTLVFVSFTGVLFPKVEETLVSFVPALAYTCPLNGAFLLASSYICYYEILNAKAGVPASILVAVLLLLANLFVHSVTTQKAILLALFLNVTGWIAQFIGHGVFEKRRPALLDNLIQAFATAPLFIVLEVLFPLGFQPELFSRIQKRLESVAPKKKDK